MLCVASWQSVTANAPNYDTPPLCMVVLRIHMINNDAACICSLQEGQGRPHLFCDMRIVDDQGVQQPHDGKAVGHLQVRRIYPPE